MNHRLLSAAPHYLMRTEEQNKNKNGRHANRIAVRIDSQFSGREFLRWKTGMEGEWTMNGAAKGRCVLCFGAGAGQDARLGATMHEQRPVRTGSGVACATRVQSTSWEDGL